MIPVGLWVCSAGQRGYCCRHLCLPPPLSRSLTKNRCTSLSRQWDAPQVVRSKGREGGRITFLLERRRVPPHGHGKDYNLPGIADCGSVSPRYGRLEVVDDGSVQAVGCCRHERLLILAGVLVRHGSRKPIQSRASSVCCLHQKHADEEKKPLDHPRSPLCNEGPTCPCAMLPVPRHSPCLAHLRSRRLGRAIQSPTLAVFDFAALWFLTVPAEFERGEPEHQCHHLVNLSD